MILIDNWRHIPMIVEDNFLSEEDFLDVKKYFNNKPLVDAFGINDMLHLIARDKLYKHRLELNEGKIISSFT